MTSTAEALLSQAFPTKVRIVNVKATPPRPRVEPVRVIVSQHAYDRAKERIGIKGKAARKRIEHAWWEGKLPDEVDRETSLWMVRKQRVNPGVTSIRVLGEFAFLFAGSTCVTILEVEGRE